MKRSASDDDLGYGSNASLDPAYKEICVTWHSGENNMETDLKGKSGLRRIVNACGYSLSGLGEAVRHEAAFRQELLLAVVLIPIALFSGKTGNEKALLIGSVMLVLIVELMNSAVESLTDRVSLDIHPLSKKAKDLGSAAVLISLLNLALVWGLIFSG